VLRTGFEAVCRRAEIRDFHFHDTRHCFASALAMRGVPLQVIAELLGHRTLAMAQRYAHLSPQVLQGAVEQASTYLRGDDREKVVRLEVVRAEERADDSDHRPTMDVLQGGKAVDQANSK